MTGAFRFLGSLGITDCSALGPPVELASATIRLPETAEACLDQAEEGRQILAAAAKCTVLTVTTDHLTPEKKTALEEAGYVLWTPDLNSAGYQSTVSLVRELQEDVVNRVEIACNANGLTLMLSAQSVLDANRNELVSATAARLAEMSPLVEEPAPAPEPDSLSSTAPGAVDAQRGERTQ